MAVKKLSKNQAGQIIEEAFLTNGYIRSRKGIRLQRKGNGIYKNGFEVRLVPKNMEDLKLIRNAIVSLGLNLCRTYQFSGQLVQPIYGMNVTVKFGKLDFGKPKAVILKDKLFIGDKMYTPKEFQKIENVVCRHFHFNTDDLKSQSRIAEVVLARQLIMYLAREYTSLTTTRIGEYLGGRSHATVLHAANKVEKLCKKNVDMKALINQLSKSL